VIEKINEFLSRFAEGKVERGKNEKNGVRTHGIWLDKPTL